MLVRIKEEQGNNSEDVRFMHQTETQGLNAAWVQLHTPQISELALPMRITKVKHKGSVFKTSRICHLKVQHPLGFLYIHIYLQMSGITVV